MKDINEIKKAIGLQVEQESEDGFMGYWFDPVNRKRYLFVFSWGGDWEHLSVSTPSHCPSWETMCKMKDIFWNEDECCIEYHPAKKDYVNMHPYCLHIWKPMKQEIPTPPTIFVGYTDKEMEGEK